MHGQSGQQSIRCYQLETLSPERQKKMLDPLLISAENDIENYPVGNYLNLFFVSVSKR